MAKINDIKLFPELIKKTVDAFKAEQLTEKAEKAANE
jgi:hypothetical protein